MICGQCIIFLNFLIHLRVPCTCIIFFPSPPAVTIGFEQDMYSVYEGFDVEVCVNLFSGELAAERMVNVSLFTDDVLGSGGALCE